MGAGRERSAPPRGRLLIIDDDRAFTVLAAAILRDAGYMVLEAFDGAQGFAFAEQDPPDVVLLDWMMPAGGGMNVLERFRATARLTGVPVIVVTASTDEGLEAQVQERGAASLLHKPLDRDRLLALVESTRGSTRP